MCVIHLVLHSEQIGRITPFCPRLSIAGNRRIVVDVNISGGDDISVEPVGIGFRRRIDIAVSIQSDIPINIDVSIDYILFILIAASAAAALSGRAAGAQLLTSTETDLR